MSISFEPTRFIIDETLVNETGVSGNSPKDLKGLRVVI
jgi:hypothetical protein